MSQARFGREGIGGNTILDSSDNLKSLMDKGLESKDTSPPKVISNKEYWTLDKNRFYGQRAIANKS